MVEFFFFFSSRRRHTRFKCDWSSDVCSSDLPFGIVSVSGDQKTLFNGEIVIPVPEEVVISARIYLVDFQFDDFSRSIPGKNRMNVWPCSSRCAAGCDHDGFLVTVALEIEIVESPKIRLRAGPTVLALVDPLRDFFLADCSCILRPDGKTQ